MAKLDKKKRKLSHRHLSNDLVMVMLSDFSKLLGNEFQFSPALLPHEHFIQLVLGFGNTNLISDCLVL